MTDATESSGRATGPVRRYVEDIDIVTQQTPRRLRRLLTALLIAWDMEELTGDSVVVLTELITNVLRHANVKRCRVTILGGSLGLHLHVRDYDLRHPRFLSSREPSEAAQVEEGRGLGIVSSYTAGLDIEMLENGKVVTAYLALQKAGVRDA